MQTNNELVSIILPVFNAGAYVADCVKSLLDQTYRNIELIAIDDDSKDNSFQILSQLRKKDKRLKVFRNKKRYGLGICLNRGVLRAKGALISFTSTLDISCKDRLRKQIKALQQNPNLIALGTQCRFIDNRNKKYGITMLPLESKAIYQTFLTNISFQFETAILKRALLPKDFFKFSGNSYPFTFSEVFIKLFQYGELANLKEALYFQRDTKASLYQKLTTKDKVVSFLKVFLKSIALYEYRPSLPSLIAPQIK